MNNQEREEVIEMFDMEEGDKFDEDFFDSIRSKNPCLSFITRNFGIKRLIVSFISIYNSNHQFYKFET